MSDRRLISEDALRTLLMADRDHGGIDGRKVVAVSFCHDAFVLGFAKPDPREVERKAWARLLRAQHAKDVGPMYGRESDAAVAEYAAARHALRDLGVDVDGLVRET